MSKTSMVKSLVCIILLGVVAFACKDNTVIEDKNVVLNGPTNLYVTNIGDSVMRLKWTASTSVNDPTFDGYTVVVRSLTESQFLEVRYVPLQGNVGTADIDNLEMGDTSIVYTFFVETRKKDGTLTTDGPSVVSAGGRRFSTLNNQPIRLYEPASMAVPPDTGKGLQLYDTSAKRGRVLNTDNNPDTTRRIFWDIVLDNDGGGLALVSPRLSSYVDDNKQFFRNSTKRPRTTYLSDSTWMTESIDDDYHNRAVVPTQERRISIPATGSGFMFYMKTFEPVKKNIRTKEGKDSTVIVDENHYAKVFVKPDANRNLIQGSSPNRYVELIYSYQVKKDIPYAKH